MEAQRQIHMIALGIDKFGTL